MLFEIRQPIPTQRSGWKKQKLKNLKNISLKFLKKTKPQMKILEEMLYFLAFY